MPKFSWVGLGPGGRTQKGTMDAADPSIVAQRLRNDGIEPKSVKKAFSFGDIKVGGKVSPDDLMIFTR